MEKIQKRTARKVFKNLKDGEVIYVTPCKTAVKGILAMPLTKEDQQKDFDKLINEFMYYNCNYETGYYPIYHYSKEMINY